MSEYVGLHGRSPFTPPEHGRFEGDDHFAPEFWEDIDRGICPRCGRTVSWDAGNQKWRVRRNLNVVLLFDREIEALLKLLPPQDEDSGADRLRQLIVGQQALNKPFEEAT